MLLQEFLLQVVGFVVFALLRKFTGLHYTQVRINAAQKFILLIFCQLSFSDQQVPFLEGMTSATSKLWGLGQQ